MCHGSCWEIRDSCHCREEVNFLLFWVKWRGKVMPLLIGEHGCSCIPVQCMLYHCQQLREWLVVRYPVHLGSSVLCSFLFFSLPSQYRKAVNVFELCYNSSLDWFSKQKNIDSRTGYVCYYLARSNYVSSIPILKVWRDLVWVGLRRPSKRSRS